MSRLVLVEAATTLPITLEEAKQHLRVTHSDDDAIITAYIGAATRWAESFTGLAFLGQTWDYYLDEFPVGPIKLPRAPLIGVIDFVSPVGGEAFTSYTVDESIYPARLYVAGGGPWPTLTYDDGANVARIRFRAGYFDTDDSPAFEGADGALLPDDIRCAILMYAGTLYRDRESVNVGTVSSPPWGAEQLLRRHRLETSIA